MKKHFIYLLAFSLLSTSVHAMKECNEEAPEDTRWAKMVTFAQSSPFGKKEDVLVIDFGKNSDLPASVNASKMRDYYVKKIEEQENPISEIRINNSMKLDSTTMGIGNYSKYRHGEENAEEFSSTLLSNWLKTKTQIEGTGMINHLVKATIAHNYDLKKKSIAHSMLEIIAMKDIGDDFKKTLLRAIESDFSKKLDPIRMTFNDMRFYGGGWPYYGGKMSFYGSRLEMKKEFIGSFDVEDFNNSEIQKVVIGFKD